MRGEVRAVRAPRDTVGRERSGQRCAVVVPSDALPRSTWLVAPTSTSARAASSRPEVQVRGRRTRVLVERTSAVDPQRLGRSAGSLTFDELRQVDAALRLVVSLSADAPSSPARRAGTLRAPPDTP